MINVRIPLDVRGPHPEPGEACGLCTLVDAAEEDASVALACAFSSAIVLLALDQAKGEPLAVGRRFCGRHLAAIIGAFQMIAEQVNGDDEEDGAARPCFVVDTTRTH